MLRAFSTALLLTFVVAAGASAADAPLRLPADPSLWINSPPVTLESLKGKGVVLYFFEEGCPTCAKKWPDLVKTAQKYQDKPVMFLAVSSGTDRAEIEQYVHTNGISWPVVLDPTREFEKSAGVGEISLQNIIQTRYVSANGQLQGGGDVNATVERALIGAAWRVDPIGLPPALKPTWMAVELGNFAQAAPMIKKAIADKKPEIKAAGEKLQAAAEASLVQEIADAEKTAASQDKWGAFKTFRGIAERYKGYPLPETFRTAGTALFNDDEVKKQLAAYEDLEALKKGLTSGSPAVRKKTVLKLDKVIADHPGTEAAQMAADIKLQAGR
jgi:peroxiredoxin